jgi:alpha-tubulin suppressor-like RCC1 family protein
MTDGTIYACGINSVSYENDLFLKHISLPEGINDTIVDLDVGLCTLCLANSGKVYAWGSNSYGQFGNGTTDPSPVYSMVEAFTLGLPKNYVIKKISTGFENSYCILDDGTIYACGEGKLSLQKMELSAGNPMTNASTFIINTLETADEINFDDVLRDIFIFQNNNIYACGSNTYNEFINGSLNESNFLTQALTQIEGIVTDIKIRERSVYFIMSDGNIYVTGTNNYGLFCNNIDKDDSAFNLVQGFINLPNYFKFNKIFIGYNHSIFVLKLRNGGSETFVYGCGDNSFGQFGKNNTISSYNNLTQVLNFDFSNKDIINISLGGSHTLLLLEDSSNRYVYACGDNSWGQLGLTDISNSLTLTPTFVDKSIDKSIKNIYTTISGSIALMNDGTVYMCGYNYVDNTYSSNLIQISIPLNKKIQNIVTNKHNAIFLTNDGILYGWGPNTYNIFGNNNGFTNSVIKININKKIKQICLTEFNSYFLMEDGTVYSSGDNTYGQLGIGLNNTPYITQMKTNANTFISNVTSLTSNFIQYQKGSTIGTIKDIFTIDNNIYYGCGSNDYDQFSINNTNSLSLLTPIFTHSFPNKIRQLIRIYLAIYDLQHVFTDLCNYR